MFGFSAFERNKKDLAEAGFAQYTKAEHKKLMEALQQSGLPAVSARKFFEARELIPVYFYWNTPEAQQVKQDVTKYCEVMNQSLGTEITPMPLMILGDMLDEADVIVYQLPPKKISTPQQKLE